MLEQDRVAFLNPPASIDRADLFRRICVRPPYFALENLIWAGNRFSAQASAEKRPTHETGPMQASELSRHAAICGLCAAALTFQDQDRRYYLAQDAIYLGFANPATYGSVVDFEANVVTQNKRQATVDITATAGGEALIQLRVTYTILNEASFNRLFRSKYSASFLNLAHAPMPDPPQGTTTVNGRTHILQLDNVPEEACAGHFDHYPALPVAVLMGQIGQVAGRMHGRPYRVESATMTATDFCWAGEAARFDVTPGAEDGMYDGVAYASDVAVSEVTVRFASDV